MVARNLIGKTYKLNRGGSAIVGQLNTSPPFDPPQYIPTGSWNLAPYSLLYVDNTLDPPDVRTMNLNSTFAVDNNFIPNVVSLIDYAVSAPLYSATVGTVIADYSGLDDYLVNGATHDNLETWNSTLDLIDNSFQWIWGNVRNGGCAMIKYDANNILVLSTSGLYKNEAGDEKISAYIDAPHPIGFYESGFLAVTYGTSTDTYDYCISFVSGHNQGVPGTPYIYKDPEATGIPNDVLVWQGNVGTIADSLDTSKSNFNSYLCNNTLTSSNSTTIGSAFRILYLPVELDLDDWYLSAGTGPDNATIETQANGGSAGNNNGDPDFDNSSDEVDFPDDSQFTVDAQSSGFVTVFKPDKTTVQDFASWLYGDLPTNFSTWLDAIAKLQKNPMDSIISLNLAHFDAKTSGSEPITFFGKSSGYSAPVVSGLVQSLDCGYLTSRDGTIHEYSGNFLDYMKSKISIVVPYCGTYSLNPQEVMGGYPHLKYYIDLLSGACIAMLKITRNRGHVDSDPSLDAILHTFTGNIFQQIPVTAVDYSNIIKSQLGLAAGVAATASGNVIGGVQSVVNNLMSSPGVERVGSIGSSYGYMGPQKPYIIQEYPWYNWPNSPNGKSSYDNYYGRPLYDWGVLDGYDGYTEIDPGTLWTDKFDWITSEEEQMIKQIVGSGGIYIDHTSEFYNYDPEDVE